jgi:hypothetical protein
MHVRKLQPTQGFVGVVAQNTETKPLLQLAQVVA